MTKIPVHILRTPVLGGAALNTLPADLRIPSLADILPYAPSMDRAFTLPGGPEQRINYD